MLFHFVLALLPGAGLTRVNLFLCSSRISHLPKRMFRKQVANYL
jgi:hypothetical protein